MNTNESIDITILMPCLNESETLSVCIDMAKRWIKTSKLKVEILVADNGSTDGSQFIAESNGARVINVQEKGYGSALYHGSLAAKGRWIIMGDSDCSYDFSNLNGFVAKLEDGYDLVMGNRFLGGIKPGAMPWKNRYIGNPILSFIGRLLFKCPAGDFHCGLRAFTKDAFLRMELRTTGMEYASEMVIKANLFSMKIAEVATTLSPDGRSRPPHLKPWRDGWRHLRFMLLFSPKWLLFYPGVALFFPASIVSSLLIFSKVEILGVELSTNALIYTLLLSLIGYLMSLTSIVVRLVGVVDGLLPDRKYLKVIKNTPVLEIGSVCGVMLFLFGFWFLYDQIIIWSNIDFGAIGEASFIKNTVVGAFLILYGVVTFIFSLVLGFLSLPSRR